MGDLFRPAGPVRLSAAALALVLSGAALVFPAFGQVGPTAAPAKAAPASPPSPPTDLDAKKQELRGLEESMSAEDDKRHKMLADIESIRTDRVRLSAALIDTTQKVRDAELKVATVESRLDTMTGSEDAIKQSLQGRRGVIAEVLASLQRMGRKPPPAILVSPDDILSSIRASMLLGAVVPELRQEAEALASDLSDLQHLRQSISVEKDALAHEVAGLGEERQRLGALIEARQAAQAAAESALGGEQGRADDLARRATSLKDLVARMEGEVASAKRAGDAARNADEDRRKAAEADANSIKERVAAGPFRDPARLSPAVGFADAKAMLFLPVAGRLYKTFGTPSEFGGEEKGLSLVTRPQAVVTAPADGWIAFSGPYRSYGQILIINAGDGYYIVLAGMGRVSVSPGQFVLAGEPVATMGDGSVKTAAAIALGATEPILYVEFRKDGMAIDPSPWWAKAELEKVRG